MTLIVLILFTSCRTEETELIEGPQDETLNANSNVATLMQRTATNDGSNDNIIDESNCFNIQLPVTVIANGTEITVNTEDDYDLIEDIFDADEEDTDTLEIIFPVTIILTDFTEVVINDMAELNSYSANCNGENESDDDIECIDFLYPITASVFNTNNELIDTVTILNDHDLYDFIEDLNEDIIVSIDFPITVILPDGSSLSINNLTELENTIETYEDDCDEDDDYDYNDDDCDNCTPQFLTDILTGCSDWYVDKLERDNNDLEDNYIDYFFNFSSDGTLTVDTPTYTYNGTWSASGTGNNITVVINIPDLPDCNANWILHEVEQYPGETSVDLRVGDDRLRYEADCN